MDMSEAINLVVDTFNRDDIEGFIAACTPSVEFRDSEAAWSERRMEPLD